MRQCDVSVLLELRAVSLGIEEALISLVACGYWFRAKTVEEKDSIFQDHAFLNPRLRADYDCSLRPPEKSWRGSSRRSRCRTPRCGRIR
jgi:hypothetical protein